MSPLVKPSKTAWGLGVLCLLLLLVLTHQRRQTELAQSRLAEVTQLHEALLAEMHVTRDALGRETATKRSLQADLHTVQALNGSLSQDKQDLLAYVAAQNKKGTVLAATVIKQDVVVKRVDSGKPVAQTDSTVAFRLHTDTLVYEAEVRNVTARKDSVPQLVLTNLRIPNTASVSFAWGDKQEGYPVSVSVTNSNPLFHTSNIESFVIPELKKETLRPTFWEKVNAGVKVGKVPFAIGVGVGVGVLLLTR